jgi:hypothetical protein
MMVNEPAAAFPYGAIEAERRTCFHDPVMDEDGFPVGVVR